MAFLCNIYADDDEDDDDDDDDNDADDDDDDDDGYSTLFLSLFHSEQDSRPAGVKVQHRHGARVPGQTLGEVCVDALVSGPQGHQHRRGRLVVLWECERSGHLGNASGAHMLIPSCFH